MASAIVWMVGPLVSIGESWPLEPENNRLALIGLLVVVWAGYLAWQRIARKKRNDKMLAEMAAGDREIDEETSVIQERFQEALAVLKSSNKGKKSKAYVYDLPWYIIIGPPGSGKTTALLNAGLTFPLEDKFGYEALKGVGGTRNCDWWFTDEAVLIDTAGRFTSQDSHKQVDEAGWSKFIELLKRYRPARPINGAMVTMSLSDLMAQTREERVAYARTIRQRIDELAQGLGISFPVYFMFTKCDMVSGFNEFFAHYGVDERAQVWGETFELGNKGGSTFDVTKYGEHFDRLVSRLEGQTLDRVHEERDRDDRAAIVGFPAQMLNLKAIISEFVSECFAPGAETGQPLLRGIYYTSGTQEGTPIDRLLGNLAQDFGIASPDAIAYSGKGKSFFLARLLKDVVFRESAIAGMDSSIMRRKKALGFATWVLAGGLLAGSAGAWTLSYQANVAEISRIKDTVEALQVADDRSDLSPFEQVARELDHLRQAGWENDGDGAALGLNQAETVRNAVRSTYDAALENHLLPVLVSRLEQRLAQAISTRDTGQIDTLRTAYLMLTGRQENGDSRVDPEFLTRVFVQDWQRMFPDNPELVSRLEAHHQRLVEKELYGARASQQLLRQATRLLDDVQES